MRKYRKVWRYLFYKYSSKKQDGGGEEKTHMGDAWKMLKDYEPPRSDPAIVEELNAFVAHRRAELKERKPRTEWRR